jgi:Holliday junction DNA helicase RuvA
MISGVIGDIVEISENEIILLVNDSIEFELVVSTQTASRLSNLRGEDKKQIRLLTWLQHRDDSMNLYAFYDQQERLLFLELIKVNGIGPRQAMRILGSVQIETFLQALDNSDVKYLATIPGIGPKTSQKIVLALKGSINLDIAFDRPKEGSRVLDPQYNDLVAALNEMGYDKKQVLNTINELLENEKESLIKLSIKEKEQYLFKNAIIKLS